jgi:L-ascorbate metabolism protein UlaG (beta-lactamase superfamily)
MKITLVADSTFIFEHCGVRILTDPWIGATIYGGAWRRLYRQFAELGIGHEIIVLAKARGDAI